MTLDTLGTQLGNQIYNILYAVIAAIVLQLIMLVKKGYKWIQIWRNRIPTNSKILKEIQKLEEIGTDEARKEAMEMKNAYVNLNRARERGKSRLSVHKKKSIPKIKIDDTLTP